MALLEGALAHDGITVTLQDTSLSVTTHAEGRFSLESVTPGTYALVARKAGYTQAQQAITVQSGETLSVQVDLRRERGSLSGTIQVEGVSDPSGVTVALAEPGTTATTNAQGHFLLEGIPTGTYLLTASREGLIPQEQTVEVRHLETTSLSLTLMRARGTVTGTLLLEGESNHSGISVSLSGHDATATTDAQGHFGFEGIPVGRYKLTAGKVHYARAEAAVDVVRGPPAPVGLTLARLGSIPLSAPRLAVQGGHLALTGSGLGEEPSAFTLTVGGRAVTDFISWSDTQVVVRVAHETVPGEQEVILTPRVAWRPSAVTSVRVLSQQTFANGLYSWGVGLQPSNEVSIWGEPFFVPELFQVPEGLTDVVSVAAARNTAFALKADGTVVAWGQYLPGPLSVPVGLTGVVAIEARQNFALALKRDGTVVAWGSNASQQTQVPEGLQDVVALSAGDSHTLALKADGTVVTWGSIWGNQVQVPSGLSGAVAIAATGLYSLAVLENGTMVAWYADTTTPLAVPEADDIVSVAGGGLHYVAVRADGTVLAWGNNDEGQATPPAGLAQVAVVSGQGGALSMVLKANGQLVYWGATSFPFAGPSPSLIIRVPAR
jgi:hypothetical protein